MDKGAFIIGIAGGTGSGKSTLANRLKDVFNDDVVLLCQDYYYKSFDKLTFEEKSKLNFDHPNSFDTPFLIDHLKKLKQFEPIERPVYSFIEHMRIKETIKVEPRKVIILEGILIFENKHLRDLMDIKIFVDTDADLRLLRRVIRDSKERGRDLDSIINQYVTTVKPMHEEFIEPSKKFADVIIPEGGMNHIAVSMLLDKIQTILRES